MFRTVRTPEQRSESARKAAATRKARKAADDAAMADKIAAAVPVKVGDFFEESWGYDQTNVDFYEVVKVSPSGKTVWLQHVNSATVPGDEDSHASVTHVVPAAGQFGGAYTASRQGLLRKALNFYSGGWSVSMTSYSNAYLWDGKPAYRTASGWGH